MSETKSKSIFIIIYLIALSIVLLMSSCSNKVLSAHGQVEDYYYELQCNNCDEID